MKAQSQSFHHNFRELTPRLHSGSTWFTVPRLLAERLVNKVKRECRRFLMHLSAHLELQPLKASRPKDCLAWWLTHRRVANTTLTTFTFKTGTKWKSTRRPTQWRRASCRWAKSSSLPCRRASSSTCRSWRLKTAILAVNHTRLAVTTILKLIRVRSKGRAT